MEISIIVKRVVIAVVLVCVIGFCVKKYTTPVFYPEYAAEDISRIIVTDNSNGSELNIVNPSDIEKIVEELSGAELKVKTQGIITPEDSYELTLYNTENLEIVDFNPVIVVGNTTIQKEPVCYEVNRNITLYDDLKDLFEETENMEQ